MSASPTPTRPPFLTAEWRTLAMLNYEVEPAVLAPWLPAGCELDPWQDKTLVSMVGFRFLNTRVMGLPIPWHRDFDEVNLRFYVRRKAGPEWRRGVVFVRELVPRAAIAAVARRVYEEPYLALPMRHRIDPDANQPRTIEFGWRFRGTDCHLHVTTSGSWKPLEPGGTAEFITEHYWGYTKRKNGTTSEYQVEHPPWNVMEVADSEFICDVEGLYGSCFTPYLSGKPHSALVADGSPITVYQGSRLIS